jgi:hypothetical protein
MKPFRSLAALAGLVLAASPAPVSASSHMDAPLLTLDDAANTTDVYAFVSSEGAKKYMTAALAVYPFEEPGIGPNHFRFDDDVLYEIHVATGADLAAGRATRSYRFQFESTVRNPGTILQAFLGPIADVGDANQNLIQRYTVTKVDRSRGKERTTPLGSGIVPPNNQGLWTPEYNQGPAGSGPAKDGVAAGGQLDRYTGQAIASLSKGYLAFAGQRDDGFYADIQAIFDGLALRTGDDRFDSQGGFNVHTMVLRIPVEELGGDQQVAGVWATTSRRQATILRTTGNKEKGRFVQVGRQGNPLFCEGLVAIADKDLYNRTAPSRDAQLFQKYAQTPELAKLINLIVFGGDTVAPETGRDDLVGIFIPDLIKVDLSTGPARLAGGGKDHPTNPDDDGFSRLGVFGNDVLQSALTGGAVPGGWPNGRRFGDDVVDIAVTALLNDLSAGGDPIVADGIDNVSGNDIAYNKVFPYAATPLSGRNHGHH